MPSRGTLHLFSIFLRDGNLNVLLVFNKLIKVLYRVVPQLMVKRFEPLSRRIFGKVQVLKKQDEFSVPWASR